MSGVLGRRPAILWSSRQESVAPKEFFAYLRLFTPFYAYLRLFTLTAEKSLAAGTEKHGSQPENCSGWVFQLTRSLPLLQCVSHTEIVAFATCKPFAASQAAQVCRR